MDFEKKNSFPQIRWSFAGICISIYSHLIPDNYEIHLWDDTEGSINLYQAIDSVKNRFGEDILIRGAHAKKGPVLDVRAELKKTQGT